MYLSTETVNKMSVPFGSVIGPYTIVSNLAKLVHDIAKIVYNSFQNRNYEPSGNFYKFKHADLDWEELVSRKYKPVIDSDGNFDIQVKPFENPERANVIYNALGTLPSLNWSIAYKNLSEADMREIELENLKKDVYQHVTFIGIGVIRSIPILGGAMLCYYDINKVPTLPIFNDAKEVVDESIFPSDFDEVMGR